MQPKIIHPMQKHIFCLFTLLLAVSNSIFGLSTVDSLLNVFEKEVAYADAYKAHHQRSIDSLCAIRPQTQELQLAIAREYQSFQCDSACAWYTRLGKTADEPIRTQAFISLLQLLSAAGHYDNAFELLEASGRPNIAGVDGYKTIWLLYQEAAKMAQMSSYKTQLEKTASLYYDSLLVALETDSVNSAESRLWLQMYRASDAGNWPLAIYYSGQLIARTTPDEHQYAILAYGHAMTYEQAGDAEKRREWLIRSAITDVRCGIMDNGSSWVVAQDCFDTGNIKQAYTFINYSLNNATYYNAPTRFRQIFIPGHIIVSRYEDELHRSSLRLIGMFVLLAIAMVVMFLLFLYGRRQNRRLHRLNEQLATLNTQLTNANHIKEQYICRYLEVYSDYIRRLTTMARKAGEDNVDEFMRREMDGFYRSFDDTFLSLYGSFVEDFNALLRPDARLTPKPGERMTIEMRIFALILLGIDNSAKIAELLCYSPNTISNYRVKIKNSALGNRDELEQRVRNIGTLQ